MVVKSQYDYSAAQMQALQNPPKTFTLFIILMLVTYFGLSGYTQVSGTATAGQGILGRLIMADIFMFFLAVVGLGTIRRIYFPIEYGIYLAFIVVNGLVGLTSYIPRQASIELIVHIWAWIGSLVLFNILARAPEEAPPLALKLLLYSTTVLAILGFLHLLFFPNLFPVNTFGGVVGTFRNAGQSGTYMGMILALIIPAMLSGMIKPTKSHLLMGAIIFLSLVFSTKRASMIGLGIGYFGLLIILLFYGGIKYKKYALNLLIVSGITIPLIQFGVEWGKENIDTMAYRLKHKLGEGALDKFANNFFEENIGAAFDAFFDRPITGVGMGNVALAYTAKYEIHSTYFKLIATSGIIGTLSYLVFMSIWIKSIVQSIGTYCREALFLLYFSPFLIGLIVSWIYTYHLRKREFWIAFAIVVLVSRVSAAKKPMLRQ